MERNGGEREKRLQHKRRFRKFQSEASTGVSLVGQSSKVGTLEVKSNFLGKLLIGN
jgi:hypothetical protein